MKRTIRLLTALLALTMLFGLVSCKSETTPGSVTTGGEQGTKPPSASSGDEGESLNIPANLNFNNEKVNLLTRSESYLYSDELWVEDAAASKVDDAVFARYKRVEEDYNLFVTLTKMTETEISSWMLNQSLNADTDQMYHVVAEHGRYSTMFVTRGLCADWNMLSYVDLSASWWSQDAIAQWTTMSGSNYMMNGDISYLSVGEAVGMFFNKDLIVNAGVELPYDEVRNNNWTYETFQQYVRTVGNTLNFDNTGKLDSDSFGYITGWWRGPMNIVNSTGNRWLTVTEEDVTLIPSSGNLLQDAFDNYFEFLYESGYCKMFGGDYYNAERAFAANRVVFYDDLVMNAPNYFAKGINFGVVPMPKYDSSVDKNYSFVNAATNIFTVPSAVLKNKSLADRVSVFLEAMAYYGQKNVLPTYYNDLLTYRSLTDTDSVEMMDVIQQGLVFDLCYYYAVGSTLLGFCDIPYNICQKDGQSSFKSEYDSLNTGSLIEEIEKWKDLQ